MPCWPVEEWCSRAVQRSRNPPKRLRRGLPLFSAVGIASLQAGEDVKKPLGIPARQLAADIDVSPSRISELVHGTRPVTADTALRLGLFFGMEPRFWLNLQTEYDMRMAARTLQEKIAPRIRVYRAAA